MFIVAVRLGEAAGLADLTTRTAEHCGLPPADVLLLS
jgi:hypothetical protein